MEKLGISREGYYRAGHAAVILIDKSNGSCSYFDFGRYETPPGMGRVRNARTDKGLEILTRAEFIAGKLVNLAEIMDEMQAKPSTHGTGPARVATTQVDYHRSYEYAVALQSDGPLSYGPFVTHGTNCSRFVNRVLREGLPVNWQRLSLSFPWMLTPSPGWNVTAVAGKGEVYSGGDNRRRVGSTEVPDGAKWLAGVGSGCWFLLTNTRAQSAESIFEIRRYDESGTLECFAYFSAGDRSGFDPDLPYEFTYPSHCAVVTIEQDKCLFRFTCLAPSATPQASMMRRLANSPQ